MNKKGQEFTVSTVMRWVLYLIFATVVIIFIITKSGSWLLNAVKSFFGGGGGW